MECARDEISKLEKGTGAAAQREGKTGGRSSKSEKKAREAVGTAWRSLISQRSRPDRPSRSKRSHGFAVHAQRDVQVSLPATAGWTRTRRCCMRSVQTSRIGEISTRPR
jgi:hypothetical protein